MATLQKTYRGDLSGAIAGVLWSRIKEANTKKELEKSNASDDIKEAAVELRKEDPSDKSIPVQDKSLRDSVVRIFGKLEGRLFSLQGKANNISGKVTTLAGGIADTQDLIINQNQLLEDKFDIILKNIGAISSIDKKNAAESELDRVEAELEKGFDLSGTFAYEKTRTGSFGIFGKILSGILGNRFTTALISQISKALLPKSARIRARALKIAGANTVKRFARKLTKPGVGIAKRILTPFTLYGGKKAGTLAARAIGSALGKEYLAERLGRSIFRNVVGNKFYARKLGSKLTINQLADLIIEAKTIDANAKRKMVKIAAKSAARNKKGVIKAGGKVIQRNIPGLTEAAGRKITKKASQRVGSKALNKALSSGDGAFLRALSSPTVQKAIVQKIGKEGAEKIGIKLAAGGAKGGFPLFGTAYGVVEGLVRLALGDPAGMLLSFGSSIPAAGWGFAIIDILRDIDKDAYVTHIKPNLPLPSDENLAGYFQQAFGLTPDQYERGNIDIKSSMIGDNTSAISEILSVTQAFGDATGFGGEAARIISDSGLGSYSVPKVTYNFDVGKYSGSTDDVIARKSRDKKKSGIDPRVLEAHPELDPNKPGDYIKLKRKIIPLDTALSIEEAIELGVVTRRKDGQEEGKNQWWDIFDRFANPAAGEGGTTSPKAQSGMLAHHTATSSPVKIDASGEPGVDFTPEGDYNRAVFDGYVSDIGHQYNPNAIGGDGRQGAGYGHYIGITSVDPKNGEKFESLYAHFPEGELDKWKIGDKVNYGDILGKMGTSADYADPKTRYHVGSGTGPHTSLDFFVPGTNKPYPNWRNLVPLIDIKFNSKPTTNQSSLNSIEANTNLASTMTNMVENGSNERLMTQRQATRKNPIVIVNNQVINNTTSPVIFGDNSQEENFFEAFNLARYTV